MIRRFVARVLRNTADRIAPPGVVFNARVDVVDFDKFAAEVNRRLAGIGRGAL